MTDLFRAAERLMTMDEEAWRRHANPWSAYTRLAGSVPTFLALFSPHWIGWWSVLPIAVMAGWTWLNPRLFPALAPDDPRWHGWAARGTMGERSFLARKTHPIPPAFVRAGWITTGCAILFMAPGVYGFVVGDFGLALGGFFGAVLAKIWFVDRMVWLHDTMTADGEAATPPLKPRR